MDYSSRGIQSITVKKAGPQEQEQVGPLLPQASLEAERCRKQGQVIKAQSPSTVTYFLQVAHPKSFTSLPNATSL